MIDQKKFEQNIKRVYTFSFFWLFLVIMPVLIPFFLDLGLNMEQVFTLQAIFGLSTAVLEVPSGYLADTWGRKKTIIVGSFISGLGYTYLIFTNTFTGLIIFEIIVGAALSLVSGTDISILYDSLDQLKSSAKQKTNSIANVFLFHSIAESTASIIGGLLVTISFQSVLYAHAFFSWIPFLVALGFVESDSPRLSTENHKNNFTTIFIHIFKKDKLLTLIFLNSIFWGLSTFVAVWMFQKYWQEQGIALIYFGIIWAIYNLTVGVTGKQVYRLEKKWGPVVLLIILSVFPICGYLGMSFFTGFIGVCFGLLFQVARGVNQVILKDALNSRTSNEYRSTVNSMGSLFFRLGFCLIGPITGLSIDALGINNTFRYLALFFGLGLLFLMLPLIHFVRMKK